MSSTKQVKLILFCSLLHSFSAHPKSIENIFDLSLEDLMAIEISIASKNDEPLKNSPSSVTIFSQEEIKQLGYTSWTELLNQVPGFYSMMNAVEGNQSYLITRGHAQKYMNTLLVLLNGHRINDDYTGGINYLIRYMDLSNVERVEVIRGPGSAIYGSNAFNGVINIITSNENNLEIGFGEFGAKKLNASFSDKINEYDLGMSISYLKDNGDTFHNVFDRHNLQTTTQDPKEVKQIRASIKNKESEFFLQYLDSQRFDYYLFRRLRDGVSEIKLHHVIAGIHHQLIENEQIGLQFSGSYQYAERESLTALTPQGNAPFEQSDFLFGESLNYKSLNLALDGKYLTNEYLILNAGLAYSQSQVPDGFIKSNFNIYGDFEPLNQVVTFTEDNQRVVLDKKRSISSAYLQAKLDVSEDIIFTLGLRYDGYNDVANSLTPRAAMIYHLDQQQTIKLLYGEAYRVPSLGDLYDEESGLTTGNNSLNASEIKTAEFVYINTTEVFQFTSTFFSNKQKNIIGFRPGDEGKIFLDNVASNHAHGLEIETVWQPTKSLRAKASLTHLWKNNTNIGIATGLPMSENIAPKSYANFSAQYFYQNWSININGNWRTKINVLEGGSLWLFNSNVIWTLSDKIDLKLNISNLLDENYNTASYVTLGADNNGNNVQYYPARGRQTMLKLNYHF